MKLATHLFFAFLLCGLTSQSQEYKVVSLGFYNLENLFDTVNDTTINDEDFLPEGKNHWTKEKYEEKLSNMAFVISQISTEEVGTGLSLLGVAEIENFSVLKDLTEHPLIADRSYRIVHYDSPDRRGIDVALIYNPLHFKVLNSRVHPVEIYNSEGERSFTRDVLEVYGELDGEPLTVLVNHWPSRSGGEERSLPRRLKAAKVNRLLVDSIKQVDPSAKIVIMGDLNDDPTSKSIKLGLRAASKKRNAKKTGLYNPMYDFFNRGMGSNAYRDNWSLFDQIIISDGLLNAKTGFKFFKANVFNKRFMIQKTGKYKDYPMRTFSGNTFIGGYSDHFPVYMLMTKES